MRTYRIKPTVVVLAGGLLTAVLVSLGTASDCAAARTASPAPAPTASPTPVPECEGNACDQVALTWDEERQQYKVQNNAARAVTVVIANWAGGVRLSVGAGQTEYVPLKSYIRPYRANYE